MLLQAKTDAAPNGERRAARLLLAGLVATVLAACSSGDGGQDVTIGSGQSADPVTLEFPVFYVKRPVPDPEDDDVMERDAREVMRFDIGADLFMRDRATPSSPEVNLTEEITEGLGDIRDVDVNYDGSKVIFSMRAQFVEGADEEDQPKWEIWEYDIASKALRQVIPSENIRSEGHDISPHYLPDGRIIFTSTRQRESRSILIDEGKGQFAAQDEDGNEDAFVLHIMNADGSGIRQISFNQSHDLYPSVQQNGKIVFTRWEHAPGHNQMDLFQVNPDGTEMELLYGANSHNTGTENPTTGNPSIIQFLSPRAMPDGRVMAIVRPFEGTGEGGDLVLIDTNTYVENRQPLLASAGMQGPAQVRALPTQVITLPDTPSPGGRFRAAAPLFDGSGRLLVSWAQCRLVEEERIVPCTADRLDNTTTPPVEAPPLYGIYIYDVRDNTQKPVVAPQEGFLYTEVVAASSRALPTHIPDSTFDTQGARGQLIAENAGVLHIRSIYELDGQDRAPGGLAAVSNPVITPAEQRPARFLRIEKAVSQPDDDIKDVAGAAFGPNRALGMREILGYAPVEPDGSVRVKVPANVAFSIAVVDAKGRRIAGLLGSQHNSWLQLIPGEERECNGCHNPNARDTATDQLTSHGRAGIYNSINPGASADNSAFPGTNPAFAATAFQDTMARTRGRVMCGGSANLSNACPPSVDIVFDDYWPATLGTPAKFDACYRSGASNQPSDPNTPAAKHLCETGLQEDVALPVAQSCLQNWTSRCRITTSYVRHIQPLWSRSRTLDADNDQMPDTDANGMVIDNKCTGCHAPVSVANVAQFPAGQLDLTDGPRAAEDDDDADQVNSYEELLKTGVVQTLNGGNLESVCAEFVIDPVTMVQTCARFETVAPYLNAANARGSRFFAKFEAAGSDHAGYMSPAELRMISEWVDIGAQYFNNPFDPLVPVN